MNRTVSTDIEREAFQADIAVLVSLMEQEHGAQWAQAEWAAAMALKYGRQTAKLVASEVGVSAGYVRHLIATAKAFPTPESRAQDLSFSHHRIAAMTEDPQEWVERATVAGWSVEQLREATRSANDRVERADRARRAEERLVRLTREYNEAFTKVTCMRVELVWSAVEPQDRADLG